MTLQGVLLFKHVRTASASQGNLDSTDVLGPIILWPPMQVAERCLKKAKDLSGLLLLHTARGNEQGLQTLASDAQEAGKQNVSFLSRFLLGKVDECIDVLVASGRIPEAAFFARTYKPSRISEVLCLLNILLCFIILCRRMKCPGVKFLVLYDLAQCAFRSSWRARQVPHKHLSQFLRKHRRNNLLWVESTKARFYRSGAVVDKCVLSCRW